FLAVLELMKIGKIKAVQTQAFGDIELESLEDVHETALAGDSYRQDESETY
ncbi:MAG: segregation/condensation protein A, partial [Eubacterium sp.]|nr:segregation/condensation protein A [Eubacterium sp.]